jgi:hypothetical protein
VTTTERLRVPARALRRRVAHLTGAPADVESDAAARRDREQAERRWFAVWVAGSPWMRADVKTAVSTGIVGLVILAWAWWEASGSADLDDQTGWLVVALLGVIVVLKAMFSWLGTGWRQVRLRRQQIMRASEEAAVAVTPVEQPAVDEAGDVGAAAGFTVVDGSARYHRSECLLVTGKAARRHVETTRANGLRPCEMCRPDETPTEVVLP